MFTEPVGDADFLSGRLADFAIALPAMSPARGNRAYAV